MHLMRLGGGDPGGKNSGSTLSGIISSGACLSACCKNYPDLMAYEAINISTLLLDKFDSVSEDSDPDPTTKRARRKTRIAKKMRSAHLTFRNDTKSGKGNSADSDTKDSS